jgi:hypothetical protein
VLGKLACIGRARKAGADDEDRLAHPIGPAKAKGPADLPAACDQSGASGTMPP